MNEGDKREFRDILQTAFETYNRSASVEVVRLWWGLLNRFSMEQVRAGFQAHMLDTDGGRFCPTPAHIVAQIERMLPAGNQHLSADEAWSLAQQALDETATVVWTQPIAQAWGIAKAVLPDKVGARMAFKAAYERMVAQQPQAKWFPSIGTDAQQREQELQKAVEMQRLPAEHVAGLLPAPQADASNEVAAQYLAKLRQMLNAKRDKPEV